MVKTLLRAPSNRQADGRLRPRTEPRIAHTSSLPEPMGSEPGYRRPVLIVQDDIFTQSRINTVIVVIITSNILL
jgi:hypothetical protein